MFRLAADRMMDDNGAPSAAKRTGNRVTKALVQAGYASMMVVMMMSVVV